MKIESTASYKASQSPYGAGRKVALAFASGLTARLWRIESDKADCLTANADRITVDYLRW